MLHVTWSDAEHVCFSAGACIVCALSRELKADETGGTGCAHDLTYVWSSGAVTCKSGWHSAWSATASSGMKLSQSGFRILGQQRSVAVLTLWCRRHALPSLGMLLQAGGSKRQRRSSPQTDFKSLRVNTSEHIMRHHAERDGKRERTPALIRV